MAAHRNSYKREPSNNNCSLFRLFIKKHYENLSENFATLKITLKNNIKQSFTENDTETMPLLLRDCKKPLTYHNFNQTIYHLKF